MNRWHEQIYMLLINNLWTLKTFIFKCFQCTFSQTDNTAIEAHTLHFLNTLIVGIVFSRVCHLERSPIFKAGNETLIAQCLDVWLHEQTYADLVLDVSKRWAFSAMSDLPLTTYWSSPLFRAVSSAKPPLFFSLYNRLWSSTLNKTIPENEGIMQINPTYDNALWRIAPSHFLRLSVFSDREHFKSQHNESSDIIHSLSPTLSETESRSSSSTVLAISSFSNLIIQHYATFVGTNLYTQPRWANENIAGDGEL